LQHSNTQQQQQQQQQPPPLQLDEQQLAALAAAAAELDAADAAPMFLERVVLWWCGVPPDVAGELQSILHLYAGVRFPDLCDATTHIMVRSYLRSIYEVVSQSAQRTVTCCSVALLTVM
jgi:hypothetical protein